MMDIEVGVPVKVPVLESALAGDALGEANIKPGSLPAGDYAALVYTGVRNGIKANAALLDWGARQGLQWDRWDTPEGDAFRSRYESYLTDPKDEPKQANCEIEVAIRLKDRSA